MFNENNNINSKNATNISWTIEEIQIWANAGLIPNELLHSSNSKLLALYIIQNQSKLFQHYRANQPNFNCQVTLPPVHELSTTYELQVVNIATGKIVKTLEQFRSFELCDGLSIEVKAKDLEQWKKDTAGAKELTTEQTKIFKEFITRIEEKNKFTRQDMKALIEEIRKKNKTSKVRHSGHFTDSKLQRGNTNLKSNKKDLPTSLEINIPDTQIKTLGIKLTPTEDKLLNAIYKLLHDKSENQNIESKSFYAGNEIREIAPIRHGNDNVNLKPAIIRIKPTDLYKEYLGKDEYSGKEIKNIQSALKDLSEKKFIIQYNRRRIITKNKKEEALTDRIEDIQPLIHIMSGFEGLTDQEVRILDGGDAAFREQKKELIIILNPILTDQINSKYIEYPSDINKRTIIASGGASRVTESIIDLRDFMMREISANRGNIKSTLNKETLIDQLRLRNYAKSGRKKLVEQRINDAIEANKKLGLILDIETAIGAKGQIKYIFTINPNFE